jgi:hypothetical protein
MRVFVLAVAVLGASASPCAAATVEVVERHDTYSSSATAEFRGEGDEVNDVRYSTAEGGRWAVFHDAAAVIRAGHGCSSVDEHTARCTTEIPPARGPGPYLPVDLRLGGGDDRAVSDSELPAFGVHGEEGDDELVAGAAGVALLEGGPGDDLLVGGVGSDHLHGGAGADVLRGGPAEDSLVGDEPGGPFSPDVMDGGESAEDWVSYGERQTPVHVDLSSPGGDGGAREDDAISGVEQVAGGLADDVLVGDDVRNRLEGGGGSDVIAGRGGDDLLLGSDGRDVIDGEDGDDSIQGAGGADMAIGGPGDDFVGLGGVSSDPFDRAECGPGDDRAMNVDVRDVVRGCEAVEVLGLLVGVPRRVSRGFAVPVAAGANPVPCRVVVTVTSRRRAVRSRAVRVRSSVRVVARRRTRVYRRPAARRLRVELRGVGCGGVGGFVVALD